MGVDVYVIVSAATAPMPPCPQICAAMGSCASCCRRRAEEGGGADTTWTQYSDRASEFQRPSTSAERRRRGVSTVSMSEEQLLAIAHGPQPKAAEAAVRELRRRGA